MKVAILGIMAMIGFNPEEHTQSEEECREFLGSSPEDTVCINCGNVREAHEKQCETCKGEGVVGHWYSEDHIVDKACPDCILPWDDEPNVD